MCIRDRHENIKANLVETDAALAALAADEEQIRRRDVQATARRLAAVQKATLGEASRSGRISDDIARELAHDLDVAIEEGSHGEPSDPELYPDESPETTQPEES